MLQSVRCFTATEEEGGPTTPKGPDFNSGLLFAVCVVGGFTAAFAFATGYDAMGAAAIALNVFAIFVVTG